jgi:hypothetical protein
VRRYDVFLLWSFALCSLSLVFSANCLADDLDLSGTSWDCGEIGGQLLFYDNHVGVDPRHGNRFRWLASGRVVVVNFDGGTCKLVLDVADPPSAAKARCFPASSYTDSQLLLRAQDPSGPSFRESTLGVSGTGRCVLTSSSKSQPPTNEDSVQPAPETGASQKSNIIAMVDPFASNRPTQNNQVKDGLVDPFGPSAKRPAQATQTQSAKSEGDTLVDPFKSNDKNAQQKQARYWNTCARVFVAPSSRSNTPNSYKVFAGNLCSQVLDVKFCVQQMNDGSGDLAHNGSWDCGIKSNTTAATARDGHPEDWYYGCCAVIYRTKVWAREPGFTEGWPEP